MNSFRLRIALINAGVSILLLASMALISFYSMYRLKVGELERDVKEFSRRGAPSFPHSRAYEDWGQRMEEEMKQNRANAIEWLLLAKDREVIYQSTGWSESILVESVEMDMVTEPLYTRPQGFREGPRRDNPANFSHPHPPPPRNPPPPQGMPRGARQSFLSESIEHTDNRIIGIFQNEQLALIVTADLRPVYAELKSSGYGILISLPFVCILLVMTSYWISGKATRPILELSNSAESIDADSLDHRIQLTNPDREFERLSRVFNEMLERLEKSFSQSRRFSSDAAHELKTPLAILQGELDMAIQEFQETPGIAEKLGRLSNEAQQISQIIRKLLYLSQADAGKLAISPVQFNLSEMIHEMVEDSRLMFDGIQFELEIEDKLLLEADPILCGQIIQNLLSNAIKYNRKDGSVRIKLKRTDSKAVLDVINTGTPIPENSVGKIFDRFYRADASRSKDVDGSGLGLSLAEEFAKAHKGSLILSENQEDRVGFRLTLNLKA